MEKLPDDKKANLYVLNGERLAGIEADIRTTRDAALSADATATSLVREQEQWRSHMCGPHGEKIDTLTIAVGDLRVAVSNKWPTLIAAAAGGLLPTAALVIAWLSYVQPAIEKMMNHLAKGG